MISYTLLITNTKLYQLQRDIMNIEIACVAEHLNTAQRYMNIYVRNKFCTEHALVSENAWFESRATD
jgi:hypothetical protein